MTALERFELHLNKTDSCWLWVGGVNGRGYGNFHYNGTTVSAHRASWELFKGSIPEGLHVLHKCDVKNCVNPDHLFVGTRSDNMKDKVNKGRDADRSGTRNPMAKFSDELIVSIKLTGKTKSYAKLAVDYGMSEKHVRDILQGVKRK